eukprot:scaffold92872_cov55-Attheya_sp.AAC.1
MPTVRMTCDLPEPVLATRSTLPRDMSMSTMAGMALICILEGYMDQTSRKAAMMRSGNVLKNTGTSAGYKPSPTWRVVVNAWRAEGGVGTEESMASEVSSLAFYVFFCDGAPSVPKLSWTRLLMSAKQT